MLLLQSHNKWLFCLFTLLMLAGCASSTEIFIPSEIKPIPNGYARIVVTRTKQLAGRYTPVYILDIGDQLESNGDIIVRVGDWISQPALTLWYKPDMLPAFSRGGFALMPSSNFQFQESSLTLDDLFQQNLNGVIYVDFLSCNPDELNSLYCGNSYRECHSDFVKELNQQKNQILNTLDPSGHEKDTHKVQVTGKILGGDTLIWDRKPGLMRIGALWGAFIKTENILEITPGNIIVEPGRTYYLQYELSLTDKTWRGDRWTITGVE